MQLRPNHLIPAEFASKDAFFTRMAEKIGTPLYLYDGDRLKGDYARLKEALPDGTELLYSIKANPNPGVLLELARVQAGFEACSRGELLALENGNIDLGRTVMTGPGKRISEIICAGRLGVGLLAAESNRELAEIERAGKTLGREFEVLLRVNPGGAAGDQQMSGATQFGMDPPAIIDALKGAARFRHLRIAGLHFYLGTRILDWKLLLANLKITFMEAAEIERASRSVFEVLDVGGGFGIPLYNGEGELCLEKVANGFSELAGRRYAEFPRTRRLLAESGRYIAASCGVMLTTVVDVKKVHGRNFAITDGGIHAIGGRDGYYGARAVPMRVLLREEEPHEEVTVCGPLCTPADRLANRVLMPLPRPGDVIALYQAGAYGPTASAGRFLSMDYPREEVIGGDEVQDAADMTVGACA